MGLIAGADGEPEYEQLGDPTPHGPGAIKEINLFGYPMRVVAERSESESD